MSNLAFELCFPGGNWVRVYANGKVDGVPDGTVIINWIPSLLGSLQAENIRLSAALDNPQPRSDPEAVTPTEPH